MKDKVIIEEIAQPVTRLPIVNNPTIHLKDRGLLAAVNYSGTGKDANLFLIDIEKMKDKKYPLPEGEEGAYGFVYGTDGWLYLGTFSGKVYSFDMDKEELKEIAHPFTNGQMIWGGGGSSSGKIYMGVYPTGEFCEYDIKTGSLEIFNPMQGEKLGFYARGFIELPNKNILIFIGGAKPTLLIYDPQKKDYQKVYSGNSEKEFTASFECFFDEQRLIINFIKDKPKVFNWKSLEFENYFLQESPEQINGIIKPDDTFYGIGDPSGRVYRIKDEKAETVKENFPCGNRFAQIHHLRGDEFMGLSDNGLFLKFDLNTKEQSSLHIQNESKPGMPIMFLKKIPGRDLVIGSHFINMQIFKINLKDKTSQSSLNKVSGYGGQVTCGTYLNDTFYFASYIKAVLYALDTELPFSYAINPKIIGEIGEDQNRPMGMVNDGEYVYIATRTMYGTLGGAITVFNPQTEKMQVYLDFVKDQTPISLFYHQPAGCLIGATDIHAECLTHQPRAEYAVVFIWDTRKRQTIHTSSPWKAPRIHATTLSPEGKLVGFKEDKYFIFDIITKEYEIREWKEKAVTGGLFMGDGYFYGATEDRLFQLDINKDKISLLEKASGTCLFEKISEKEFLFDHERSIVKKLVLP